MFKPKVPCVTEKTQRYAYPSYRDNRFLEPQLVYDNGETGDHCEYSDRLYQWDREAHLRGNEAARKSGIAVQTPAYVEAYLSGYYQSDVQLHKIEAGFEPYSGHPYFIYSYTVMEETKGEKS